MDVDTRGRGRPRKAAHKKYVTWHVTLDPLTSGAAERMRRDGEGDSALLARLIRRATMLIVAEGEVHPIEDAAQFPVDRYGVDWIAVEARDAADALAQAALYDAGAHPAQTEMWLFAAMVRAGTVRL